MISKTNLIENITFENDDTEAQMLIKVVQLYAGSHRLKTEMKRLKVDFVRVDKGAFVTYILRSKTIGRITVKL